MNKSVAGIVAFGVATLVSSAAFAQDAGAGLPGEGNFVLGAERMFGFQVFKASNTYTDPISNVKHERKVDGTQFSLLWSGLNMAELANVSTIPRIGADYMVSDLISLGGSLGYYSLSGTAKDKNTPPGVETSADLPDFSGFAIAPRIGFMIPISETVGFWPRAGFTYASEKASVKDTDNAGVVTTIDSTTSIEQINLEGMFFIAPVEHFAFILGPNIDLGVGGKEKQTASSPAGSISGPDHDVKLHSFGVVVGLGGWF